MVKNLAASVQTLSVYCALGIVCFGWAMGRLLGFSTGYYAPLWLCGALFVYNLDRLRHDPADALNLPRRAAAGSRLRRLQLALVIASAALLVLIPLVALDWKTFALTVFGSGFCAAYSAPFAGFRLKDVPWLKTFFAPGIVTAAIFGLPLVHGGIDSSAAHFLSIAAWAGCYLLFNMILCDQRDLAGDAATGTHSLPAALGPLRTLGLQVALIAATVILALGAAFTSHSEAAFAWLALALAAPAYLGALLLTLRQPRGEHFYEWWVEGMLYLPALVVVALG